MKAFLQLPSLGAVQRHLCRTFLHVRGKKKNLSGHFPEFSIGEHSMWASAHICKGKEKQRHIWINISMCLQTEEAERTGLCSFKVLLLFMSLGAAEASLQFPNSLVHLINSVLERRQQSEGAHELFVFRQKIMSQGNRVRNSSALVTARLSDVYKHRERYISCRHI